MNTEMEESEHWTTKNQKEKEYRAARSVCNTKSAVLVRVVYRNI